MTLIELYQSYGTNGKNRERSRALLAQTHWYSVNANFDPKTGDALPQRLSEFLAKVGGVSNRGGLYDRLWRITEHARTSVERLFRALNESPRREHTLLPIRSVRELDANSFIKLSNRPGRNIREKLAGKPYLQAVRRFQSVDLPENRLLKAFVIRLAELLELRQQYLDEEPDELLAKILLWLTHDEAKEIARWENLPPNNTLLSHRDYRRVWDAWRRLQSLDEDIERDFLQLESRDKTMRAWNEYGRLYSDGNHQFTEMPILFDYEKFEIRPWVSPLVFRNAKGKISRNFHVKETLQPACVDLTTLRPCYATTAQGHQVLPNTYLWQYWKNDRESVDIELFNSDAAYLHPDATSITSSDLFFSKGNIIAYCDRAALAFASKLRDTFKGDTFIWLFPDFLNDFELEITRRNLNARFSNAEPLPRSVAAVFQQVDYSKIKKDGFTIVVVDTIGGRTCVTKLLARFDPELKQCLPETKGFYWERCPPIIIASSDSESNERIGYDISAVDGKGHWRDAIRAEAPQVIDPSFLKRDARIGQFEYCINLTGSPVAGGIRLHQLQIRAGNVPLWRDRIPELSIKLFMGGYYQRFYLVSRGKTVIPLRGLHTDIPVPENFTLPVNGKPYYTFPLFLGDNADELGFSARLDSTAFPLKEDVVCRLALKFEYGANEPYKLIFTPLNKSFPPVSATWCPTRENTNAPAPEYPTPITWNDLRNWKDAQGQSVDLIKWLIDALIRLSEMIPIRSMITITEIWKSKCDAQGNKYWFSFAITEDGKKCYCNTKQVVNYYDGNPNDDYPIHTKLFCNIRETTSGLAAFDISNDINFQLSLENKQRIISFKERSLQNRMSLIWADGRSLEDSECPAKFREIFEECISYLLETLPAEIIDRKLLFLLACLHKDSTGDCIQWIAGQVEKRNIRDPRAVGFALGDVSQAWQQQIFSNLVSKPSNSVISVLAYAIWRERHLVEKFSLSELHAILSALSQRLANIHPLQSIGDARKDKWTIRNWIRATAEPLELLLGLLRTRESTSSEIKMLLQPNQEITKKLAKQVERVTEIVVSSNLNLFSRVQLNIQKPPGERTPDLLYALRLYLTGDDGASAIHITSVSDNDND